MLRFLFATLMFLPRQIRAEYGSVKRGFIEFANLQASN